MARAHPRRAAEIPIINYGAESATLANELRPAQLDVNKTSFNGLRMKIDGDASLLDCHRWLPLSHCTVTAISPICIKHGAG